MLPVSLFTYCFTLLIMTPAIEKMVEILDVTRNKNDYVQENRNQDSCWTRLSNYVDF